MKTTSNPLLQRVILCLGVVLTIWGCDNVPQKSVNKVSLIKDSTVIAKANAKFELGMKFDDQGKYADALKNYLEALTVYEKLDEKNSVARIYNAIGVLNVNQSNDKLALGNFLKSITIREKILENNPNDTICQKGRASTINNIGMIFDKQGNYKQALNYFGDALKIAEKLNNKKSVSLYCNNFGNVYRKLGDYRNSLFYLIKGLKIKREIGDKIGEARVLVNIGAVQSDKHKFVDALSNFEESFKIIKQIGDKNLETEIYFNLARTYAGIGNYVKAFEYHQKYSEFKESIVNEESTLQFAEMATKYETEKKQAQIEIQGIKLGQQKFVIFIIAGIVVVVIFFAFWFFRTSQKERKAKRIISAQKVEVEKQKKEITDSINYSKRIQQAMLPKLEDIKSDLPESFVFYQPKDIVSGDFYWFQKVGDDVFIAAADCTGHGVPGAFTSALCSTALDEAVRVTQNPAEILEFVNRWIKRTLKQTGGETRDGMDIALVKITRSNIIQYAGANRPLYILRNNAKEVEEIKADKTAIGGFTEDDYRFTSHVRTLESGENFYISSDGFADQFGGPKGKKVTTKQFKEKLLSIQALPMEKQNEELEDFMRKWRWKSEGGEHNKDSHEQVDDFLVIGVKMV